MSNDGLVFGLGIRKDRPAPKRRAPKNFVTTCIGSTTEAIRDMLDRKEHRSIRKRTFQQHVGPENWRDFLSRVGHQRGVRTPLSFGKSVYRGKPCVYARWSGVEYVYNPVKTTRRRRRRSYR